MGMALLLPLVLALVLFVAAILPAQAIRPSPEWVEFGVPEVMEIGNHTLPVTLTGLLGGAEVERIEGTIGYSIGLYDTLNTTKYYMDVSVRPDEMPKTFHIDVSFTETGRFTGSTYYRFPDLTSVSYCYGGACANRTDIEVHTDRLGAETYYCDGEPCGDRVLSRALFGESEPWLAGGYYYNDFEVVEEYGKAVDGQGRCRNDKMAPVIRPDFSSVACVYGSTAAELRERGWH